MIETMRIKILVALFIIGIQFNTFAQKDKADGKRVDHLITTLELSDEQADQIKEIFDTYKAERTSENRKEQREALDAEIAEVLSEGQLAKFEELKSKGKRKFKGRKGKQKRGKAEKDEEVVAKLLEMRAELEEQLSEDEKATLSEVRENIAGIKATLIEKKDGFKDLSKEEKKALREELKPFTEEIKAEHVKVKEIAEKYKEDIKAIFEDNKAFFEEKKAERKAEKEIKKEEWKENQDETEKPKGRKAKRGKGQKADKEGKGRRGFSKGVHFLLLDPNGTENANGELLKELNTISIAPNPANTMTNVSFEVKQGGMIRVEIRDESGKVYDTIANEELEAGSYTRQVDTNKYLDKIYYISISDGKSVQTEKLIIQK